MSQLSKEMIQKVALLARLSFTDSDMHKLSRQLSDIVNYVEKLNKLDTTNVVPLSDPFETGMPSRGDTIKPSLPVEEVMKNAPESKSNYFVVPKVI